MPSSALCLPRAREARCLVLESSTSLGWGEQAQCSGWKAPCGREGQLLTPGTAVWGAGEECGWPRLCVQSCGRRPSSHLLPTWPRDRWAGFSHQGLCPTPQSLRAPSASQVCLLPRVSHRLHAQALKWGALGASAWVPPSRSPSEPAWARVATSVASHGPQKSAPLDQWLCLAEESLAPSWVAAGLAAVRCLLHLPSARGDWGFLTLYIFFLYSKQNNF